MASDDMFTPWPQLYREYVAGGCKLRPETLAPLLKHGDMPPAPPPDLEIPDGWTAHGLGLGVLSAALFNLQTTSASPMERIFDTI
jgi:hypothetical protein